MQKARSLAVVLAFVGLSVVMASGLTAVWLTEELRVLSLVILPTIVVATLLVLYFEWRGKLQRQALAELDGPLSAMRQRRRNHDSHKQSQK
jgi:hypothetical protein